MRRTILLLLLGAVALTGCAGVAEKRDYYYRLGEDHYRKCEYKLAETYFQNSVQVDPEFADGYKRLADCCIRQNRWQDAESLYRQAIRIKPENADARLSLAELLAVDGRIRESWAFFAELPLAASDCPPARLLSGMINIVKQNDDIERMAVYKDLTRLGSDYGHPLALNGDDKDVYRPTFTMRVPDIFSQAYVVNETHFPDKMPTPPKNVERYPAKPLFNEYNGTVLYRYRGSDPNILSHPVLMIAGGLMFVLIVFKRGYMDGND